MTESLEDACTACASCACVCVCVHVCDGMGWLGLGRERDVQVGSGKGGKMLVLVSAPVFGGHPNHAAGFLLGIDESYGKGYFDTLIPTLGAWVLVYTTVVQDGCRIQ